MLRGQVSDPIECNLGDSIVLVPSAFGYGHTGAGVLSSADDCAHIAATALRLWPCARALASALHTVQFTLEGLNVLELGAGCGLPGLAAWEAGAARVLLTDLVEHMDGLKDVINANEAPMHMVSTAPLDWTQPLPEAIRTTRWDVVLAADCVFWPHLFDPLLSTIASILSSAAGDDEGRQATATVSANYQRCALLCVEQRLGRDAEFELFARQRGWTVTERSLPSVVCFVPCEPSTSAPTHAPPSPGSRLLELVAPTSRPTCPIR